MLETYIEEHRTSSGSRRWCFVEGSSSRVLHEKRAVLCTTPVSTLRTVEGLINTADPQGCLSSITSPNMRDTACRAATTITQAPAGLDSGFRDVQRYCSTHSPQTHTRKHTHASARAQALSFLQLATQHCRQTTTKVVTKPIGNPTLNSAAVNVCAWVVGSLNSSRVWRRRCRRLNLF